MSLREKKKAFHIFYGWYILSAAFLILFFDAGARLSIGVVFKPLIADFGWSRGSISFAFFLNMTMYALALPFAGRAYDRYGPKWVLIVSTIFVSIGYAGISQIQSYWQFLSFYSVIFAVGLAGPSISFFATVMSKWFETYRGFAISLGLAGSCIGQFALVPLITVFLLHYGWRALYVTIGIIILFVNIALALFVVKGDPDTLGIEPYQTKPKDRAPKDMDLRSPGVYSEDLGLWEAMHTRSYWLYLFVMFACGSGDYFVTTHLIPFVTDYGISPTTAGNMLAAFGLLSLFGILIAGPAADFIGNKIPLALTFVLRLLLFLMILKYKNMASFYIFSLAFGFTFLISANLTPTLIGRLYGLTHVGILCGFITTFHQIGAGFWAYVGGWIYDQTGSYQLAFYLSAIKALLAVICMIFIKEKKHPPS